MVRKGTQVATQIYNRLVEQSRNSTLRRGSKSKVLKRCLNGNIFSIQNKSIYMSINAPDHIYIVDSRVFKINNFVEANNEVFVKSNEILLNEDLFTLPLKSSLLGIKLSQSLVISDIPIVHKVADVTRKAIIFNLLSPACIIVIPLIHNE